MLLEAMSERALRKSRQETRVRELERKTEVFRREQIEKERAKQVRLIGTIYVEPLAFYAPTTKETIIFEQE
jgi:hypothetical protein